MVVELEEGLGGEFEGFESNGKSGIEGVGFGRILMGLVVETSGGLVL